MVKADRQIPFADVCVASICPHGGAQKLKLERQSGDVQKASHYASGLQAAQAESTQSWEW